jgi:undecaprenyl-diphosphatase
MRPLIFLPIITVMQYFQKLDIDILRAIFDNRISVLDPMFIFITDSAAAIAFGVPGILLIISYFRENMVLRQDAFRMLIPVALSAIVANILKYTIDLPRPYEIYTFIEKLSVGGSPSFPSGHTADAFAFAIAAGLVYPKWYIIIPGLIWASLVGYSRMCLGVHFPTDVLAGAIIGAVCASVYYWIKNKEHQIPE